MLDWLRKRKRETPLSGAPPVRRRKTYSAQSGFVYQYHYQGRRPASQEPATEYVFEVSPDRRPGFPVSVLVEHAAVEAWEASAGRLLRDNERYAVAKMALFQAFDEREDPAAMRQPVRVRAADVALILQLLGF